MNLLMPIEQGALLTEFWISPAEIQHGMCRRCQTCLNVVVQREGNSNFKPRKYFLSKQCTKKE
jgi:hypothetical protein